MIVFSALHGIILTRKQTNIKKTILEKNKYHRIGRLIEIHEKFHFSNKIVFENILDTKI